MFHDPVEERLFKTDVVTRFFTLDPFVAEDFLPLGEELFVEQGFFDEGGIFRRRSCSYCVGENFYNAARASMLLTRLGHESALTGSRPDAYAAEVFRKPWSAIRPAASEDRQTCGTP